MQQKRRSGHVQPKDFPKSAWACVSPELDGKESTSAKQDKIPNAMNFAVGQNRKARRVW